MFTQEPQLFELDALVLSTEHAPENEQFNDAQGLVWSFTPLPFTTSVRLFLRKQAKTFEQGGFYVRDTVSVTQRSDEFDDFQTHPHFPTGRLPIETDLDYGTQGLSDDLLVVQGKHTFQINYHAKEERKKNELRNKKKKKSCKKKEGKKRMNDPVMGPIELGPVSQTFVKTPEFKRLGKLQQMGLVSCHQPWATYTRMEHALAVAHYVGEWVKFLGKHQSNLNLHSPDLYQLAALALPLGFGPFGDMHDHPSQIQHHVISRSVALLHRALTGHLLDLDGDDWEFVRSLIEQTHPSNWMSDLLHHSVFGAQAIVTVMKDVQKAGGPCDHQYRYFYRNVSVMQMKYLAVPMHTNSLVRGLIEQQQELIEKYYQHPRTREAQLKVIRSIGTPWREEVQESFLGWVDDYDDSMGVSFHFAGRFTTEKLSKITNSPYDVVAIRDCDNSEIVVCFRVGGEEHVFRKYNVQRPPMFSAFTTNATKLACIQGMLI